jgi:transposase-like protein
MNIIKERRKRGAVCPRCKHPDYTAHPPIVGETIKPEFRCKACGHSWSYGYDGGMYAELSTPNDSGLLRQAQEGASK